VILTPDGAGAYGGGTYDLLGPPGAFAFPTRPVLPGETLLLYGVGFGPTNPPVHAGQPFSSAAPTVQPVTVSIGGVPANTTFSGLVAAGLYQFNVTVPQTVPGDMALSAAVGNVQATSGSVVSVESKTETGISYLAGSLAGGQPPPTVVMATSATLAFPSAVAGDSVGNVYLTSQSTNAVYKLDGSGNLTRVAGNGRSGYAGDGSLATSALLFAPNGVAVDAPGNLFIADTNNHRIRKIATNGTITTVAGIGCCGYSGDGGPATSAQLNSPSGVAADSAGNLYIADTANQRIRKIAPDGTITTLAGNGSAGYSGDGSPATMAQLNYPNGVAVDAHGNVYIADTYNQSVRKIVNGMITTVAGNGTCCYSGDGGLAIAAQLCNPRAVVLDGTGNLYIADMCNHRIRKVAPNGTITTVAGNGSGGYTGEGAVAANQQLNEPYGVTLDALGSLYIADYGNQRIRKVSTAGAISTVAGGNTGDGGPAPFAGLNEPTGVSPDDAGNVYVADAANHRVRKIAANGEISTVAGTGIPGYSGDGGLASNAQLSSPQGVLADNAGNLFVADSGNNRVRKVSSDGSIQTIAQLNNPWALALDQSGNLYSADAGSHTVSKIAPNGTITTVAGTGLSGFSGDAGPATLAQLNSPRGVAVDSAGVLYISDTFNFRVRRVASSGTISTVAGNGSYGYSGDGGPATSAELSAPFGLALDSAWNLYVADNNSLRIRQVSAYGTIVTVAGSGYDYSGDGGPAIGADFRIPQGVAVDGLGKIYVADTYNNAIRLLTPFGVSPVLTIASTHTGAFQTGQNATYTLVVTNATSAAPTTGVVTVTDVLPAGLALVSMSGSGWNCAGNSCTRSDALSGGSYPSISVTVNVSSIAPLQVTNRATVSGGGGTMAAASDLTLVQPTP
jgi:uncharacterized repeat protein (TIGR01451 family)